MRTMTAWERAEALVTTQEDARDAHSVWVGLACVADGESTAAVARALADELRAAIEAAARDATEAAAAVCDRIVAHEDRAALKAREALEFEARDRHWHRRDAAHECGRAIRKGEGGEHGQ